MKNIQQIQLRASEPARFKRNEIHPPTEKRNYSQNLQYLENGWSYRAARRLKMIEMKFPFPFNRCHVLLVVASVPNLHCQCTVIPDTIGQKHSTTPWDQERVSERASERVSATERASEASSVEQTNVWPVQTSKQVDELVACALCLCTVQWKQL